MKKIALFFIVFIFIIGFASAKLSDEQINQVVEKISQICRANFNTSENLDWLNEKFNEYSIESGALLPPVDFEICDNHILRFYSERIFLDGEDISTISQKTEINQTINEDVFFKLGDINLSIFGGVSFISIFSITLISIPIIIILIKRKIKIWNYLFTFEKVS